MTLSLSNCEDILSEIEDINFKTIELSINFTIAAN